MAQPASITSIKNTNLLPEAFYAAVLADYVTGKIKESNHRNNYQHGNISSEDFMHKTSEMRKNSNLNSFHF